MYTKGCLSWLSHQKLKLHTHTVSCNLSTEVKINLIFGVPQLPYSLCNFDRLIKIKDTLFLSDAAVCKTSQQTNDTNLDHVCIFLRKWVKIQDFMPNSFYEIEKCCTGHWASVTTLVQQFPWKQSQAHCYGHGQHEVDGFRLTKFWHAIKLPFLIGCLYCFYTV